MRAIVLWASLFLSVVSRAGDELSPDTAASVEHDQQKALDKIDEQHGNKTLKEMSPEERREYFQEQRKAKKDVLEKHGLDDKAYSRYDSSLSKQDREDKKAAAERLEKRDKEEAEKKASAKKEEPKEPIIQRGFSDKNPVDLDSKEGGSPVVEKGLPPGEGDEAESKPSRGGHKGSKKSDDY